MSYFWLFLLLLVHSGLCDGSCAITELTHHNATSTSVTLTWKLSCPQQLINYEVNQEHVRFLACSSSSALNSSPDYEESITTTSNQVVLINLKPYSRYKVGIVARLRDGSSVSQYLDDVETLSDVPQTKPEPAHPSSTTFNQAIHFYWSAPSRQKCENQQGIPDGYYYELWGLDEWVKKKVPLQHGVLSQNVLEYYAQRLTAYTSYKLLVFALNQGFLYNKNLPLELTNRTLSHIPAPPSLQNASPTSPESIHLRWAPKYPPTGIITQYIVRYGTLENANNQTVWRGELEVSQDDNYCHHSPPSFCHVIHDLQANQTYAFQIKAYNDNVTQGSKYSDILYATTDPDPSLTTFSSPSTSSEKGVENEKSGVENENSALDTPVIALIASLVIILVLALIGTAIVYRVKMKKLKMRYEQRLSDSVQNYGEAASVSTNMTTANYIASVASQIEEIQSRRLPEPPPSRNKSLERHYCDIGVENLRQQPDLLEHGNKYKREREEDLEGYLKPTFPRIREEENQIEENGDEKHKTVIPTESYVTAVQFVEQQQQEQGYDKPRLVTTAKNESLPLIPCTSSSVQV